MAEGNGHPRRRKTDTNPQPIRKIIIYEKSGAGPYFKLVVTDLKTNKLVDYLENLSIVDAQIYWKAFAESNWTPENIMDEPRVLWILRKNNRIAKLYITYP